MNQRAFFLFVLLIVPFQLFSQQFTLSGYIKDKETGEGLIAASVFAENQKKGTNSDDKGFFSITLPKDSVKLVFTYFGYITQVRNLYLDKDMVLTISMESENTELEEVVIKTDPHKEALESTQMSSIKLTTKEAKLIPAFMGEVDLLKTLQLKPGIQSGGEGSSGLYVRGGGPDQNLILLDDAPVYNPNHLFGFFSVFNSDAIRDVELYKGGFPAQYGGRLSSVVDIHTNDGSRTKYGVSGGIGAIASRLTLEGPIKKNKASFLISARRTYFDAFTRIINRSNKNVAGYNPIPNYYFYDLNGKISWDVGEKDKLFLSGYFGNDIFGFNQGNFDFNFHWGNRVANLRWNHVYNSKLYSNISLIYSSYRYDITNRFRNFYFELGSQIKDINAKADFDYFPNEKHHVKFGTQAIYHQFTVGRLQGGTEDKQVYFSTGENLAATELGAYVSDDYTINARWKMNAGLRLTGFAKGSKFYSGVEPRLSVRYAVNEKISVKGSFSRMYQYIHLVSNSGASLPTDVWYPSNSTVRPQRSDQVAGGVTISLWKDKLLLTDEIYHKWMKRQIDLRDGAQIFANPNLTGEFVFGKGWSYGNEIYLEKKSGKTTGWIGYTLSWTWRQFPSINNGEKFHARYDRRHDISIVVIHQLSERLNITATWVYGSGNWISLPVGRFVYQNVPGAGPTSVPEYLTRNSFRMPSYHRMDLGLVWKFKPKHGEKDLTFSLYNVYNRRNPYFIYFDEVKDAQGATARFAAKQVSLFPIIPSLTFNFKF